MYMQKEASGVERPFAHLATEFRRLYRERVDRFAQLSWDFFFLIVEGHQYNFSQIKYLTSFIENVRVGLIVNTVLYLKVH